MSEQEIDQLVYQIQLLPNMSTLQKYYAIQWIRQCPLEFSVVIDLLNGDKWTKPFGGKYMADDAVTA